MNSDLLFLGNKSILTKILAFICLVCLSLSFFYLISIALISPLFGVQLIQLTEVSQHLEELNFVHSLEFLQIVQAIGFFLVPGFLFSYLTEKNFFSYSKMNVKISIMPVVIVLTLVLAIQPLINYMGSLNSRIHLPAFMSSIEAKMLASEDFAKKIEDAFLQLNSVSDYLVITLMMAVLPAIGEELLFRGIIQSLLKSWFRNVHWGIFVTAFLFSAIHMQFLGFIPRLVLGMILGYLFEWSGSLWLPVAAHFINNSAAILFEVLHKKEMLNFNPDKIGLGENNQMMLIASFAISALLLFRLSQLNSGKITNPET